MANIPTFEEWRKKKDAEESAAKQRDVSPASYNNAPSYAEWVQSERGQSVARGDVATYSQRAPYMAQTQAARRAAVQRVLDQQNLQREADILADRAQRGVSTVWQNRPAPGGTGIGQLTQTPVRESVGYDETIDRAAAPGAVYGISTQPMGGAIGGALPYAQGQTSGEEENVAEGERIYNEYLTRREEEARNALYQPVDPNQSSIEAYGDAVRQLQDDDSDYRIQPNWTEGERRTFYGLIGSGREGAAQSYARRVNREAVAFEERQNRDAVSSRAQEQTERAAAYTSGVVDALTDSTGNIFDRALNVAKSVFSIGKGAKSAAATAGLAAQTLGASIAQVFTGGADFLTDLLNYSAGRGIVDDGAVTPNEWANEYTAGVAQALNDTYGTIDLGDNIFGYVLNGKGVGDIYGLATSMLNSRIAMAVGNSPFTLISFFGQAASSGIDEAKERGATDEAALVYGAVVGAAEAVSEFLGIEKLLKTPTPVNFATWLKNIVGQGATEGTEEAFSAIISAISDTILGAADETYNSMFREAVSQYMTEHPDATEQDAARHAWRVIIGDVVFSMLGGFITGAAQGVIQSGINTVRTDRQLQSEYGDTYRARSVEMAADETLPKNVRQAAERAAIQYATRGRASTAILAQLLNYENTKQYEADLAAIKTEAARMLSANGETQNVDAVATAIAKRIVQERAAAAVESDRYALRGYADAVQRSGVAEYADSLDLTARESRALNRSENAEQITEQLADYTAQNAQISADSAMAAEADQAAADAAAVAADGIQAAQSVDTDADGNAVVIDANRPIASLRDGKVMLNLEGGGTVDASSVMFARESDAMKYAALAELENITDLAAESMLLRINDGADAQAQIMGMYEAYMAGRYGISPEMSEASGFYANYITPQQRAELYRVGNAERMEERSRLEREERESADRNRNAARNYRRGTVTLPDGVTVDTANAETAREKRRAAAVKTANVLAGALGIDIVFYESQGDANKPNGYYKNGVIYLDLDAGESGQGVTIYTMAHELTHYIREWSPAKYRVLADFLVEQYNDTYRGNAEDLTINDLVAAQQEKAKRNNDTLTYDQAFEEFVADSLSGVLMSGKAIDRMIELRKRDATLYERMKSALRRYTNRVRRYLREGYEGIDPETQEGLAVAAVDGAMDKLELIFADAALQASNNMMVFVERVADSPVTESPVSVTDFASASYRSLAQAAGFGATEEDGRVFLDKQDNRVTRVTEKDIEVSPIGALLRYSRDKGDFGADSGTKYKNIVKMFADVCNLALKTGDFQMAMAFQGSAVFTAMKANSDKQYGTTYDFPSICIKTQAMIRNMSAAMLEKGGGLTDEEILAIYRKTFEFKLPVPCAECYVFSRWIGVTGLLDNIHTYQKRFGAMEPKDVKAEWEKMRDTISDYASKNNLNFGKAKSKLSVQFTKAYNKKLEDVQKKQNQGEFVKQQDLDLLDTMRVQMETVKAMTWIENVYFANSSMTKVNNEPVRFKGKEYRGFEVPNEILFDLEQGEAFATLFPKTWAFRTTQGAGYGKDITPYAESVLGEGILVTANTSKTIKDKALGNIKNPFLETDSDGNLTKAAVTALNKARLKQLAQAFIGGQRFQSTSDAVYANATDYLLAVLELQSMHGMAQVYTKVDGAVPAFDTWNMMINQSLMPLVREKDGKAQVGVDERGVPIDTIVGGMHVGAARENRTKYVHAGTITIGLNDTHIRAMMKQAWRDFIIPYHASGGKGWLVSAFRSIAEGGIIDPKTVRDKKSTAVIHSTDYTSTQSEKELTDLALRTVGKSDEEIARIKKMRVQRLAILTNNKNYKLDMEFIRGDEYLSRLYDRVTTGEFAGVKFAMSVVDAHLYPNEYWDFDSTYDAAHVNVERYLEYCDRLGYLHKFSGTTPRSRTRKTDDGKTVSETVLAPVMGYNENNERVRLTDLAYEYDENGNKTDVINPYYWKVLIDHRMYDNEGNYLAQPYVTLETTSADTVANFAKNNLGRQFDQTQSDASVAAVREMFRGGSASYRGGTVGTREILARALSTEADEKERRALDRYRKTIADIEALEKQHNELGEQLKALRSTRANARDVAKIASLTAQRDAIATEIVQKDSALLKLQSTAALKELVKRERIAAARATKVSANLANERRKDLYAMRELRGKIIDAAKSLDDMVSKRDKKNPIMEHLREPVKRVLAMLRTNVEDAFGNTIQGSGNMDAFYAAMDSLYARYSDLKTADGEEQTVWNEETESFLKSARDALGEENTVTDLNTEQLLDVYKALRAVLGSVRGENTLFATERRETAIAVSATVEQEINAASGGKEAGARSNLVRGLSRFGWNMLAPQTAFNLIGSPTLQRLFDNVQTGSYEWYRSIETARDKRREIDRKYNVRNWDTKKRYELTDAYGKKFTVSLQQMLSLYALSRRDAAKTHLMSGGIILVDDTNRGWFDKYEDRSTADHSFTEEQIANMGATLTKEQRGYVESMVDYLSGDLAKAGNAASMKLLGMELFTEKNYFPMKTYLFHEMENRESDDIMASMRNYGFTNSTKPNASSPLLIRSFDGVWDTHVNQMSLYATMMLPLEDFSRVYNINNSRENIRGARVAEIVERVYGREANDYIRKLFRDINGGVQRFDGESNFLGKLVSSMKRASIFGSASVVIQQPTSIYRALAYIDPKYFFGRRIANASAASLSREWEQLVAHAPIAGLKEMGYFDVNMGAGVSNYLNEPDATFAERVKMLKDANIRRQTIDEVMGKGIAVADEIGWVTLWDAVKREQADKHPNANHNSKAFLDMCGKRFAEVASATQVYDSVLSRSGFMRGNEYTKAFAMFMSEPTLMVNMVVNAFLDAKRGDKRAAARTAASVAASIFMNTLAVSLIYAIRDDDEDETFVEKYAQSVLRESADAVNPMSYLPFFRDIHAALMGYDQERPEYSKIVDVITNITRMSNAAVKLVTEDMDEDKRREQVRTFINNSMRSAMSVVDAFGFPGSNLYRIITSAGNASNLLTNGLPNNMRRFGELLVDEAAMAYPTPLRPWVKLAVNSDEERLLNAAQNGDYAYLNRIRAQHEPTESIFGTYHIEQAIAADDAKLVDVIKTDRINAYKADGVSAEDAKQKWESSVRNAVSNLVDDGIISKDDAEKYLTKYGGKTRADAEDTAAKIAYNATYDIPYYDIEDEWRIGKITDSQAVQMIVDYGYDRPYAQRRVKAFGYAKQYADLESGAVQDWLEKRDTHPETQTVSEPVYVQYRYKIRDIEGDGKKSRIMAVIHALPLSTAQKDALYFDAGYADSTLDEAPWYQ